MQPLLKSEIFFFIASIATILWTIIFFIFGIYLIKMMKNVAAMSEKLKDDLAGASEEFKEMAEDVRESLIFRIFFGKRRKKNHRSK